MFEIVSNNAFPKMNIPTPRAITNMQNNRVELNRKEEIFHFFKKKKKSFYQHFVRASLRLKSSRFLKIILFKPFNFSLLWTFLRSLISSYRKRDITCPICLAKSLSSLSTLIHLCKHIWICYETARSILEAMRSH